MFKTLLSGHASYDTQKNWISLAKETKIKKWNYLVYKEADLDKKKWKSVINIRWKWNRFFVEKSKGKRGKCLKNIVTNVREFEQLTETLKQKM